MRKLTLLIIMVSLSAITASARTWTLQNGQTINGDFHRIEKKWIVVITDDGKKRPINIAHLVKKDKIYAQNLAAILGNKPPEIEAVDPAKRVPINKTVPGNKTKPIEKKPSITLTLEPETDITPQAEVTKPEIVEDAEPTVPQEINISEEKPSDETPSEKPKAPEVQKIEEKKLIPQLDPLAKQKNRVTKTIKKSKLLILADALDSSLKKNKKVTIYFLILCLLILIHKMHMPHLYKTEFKPGSKQPEGQIKKEFDKDDNRERYRACPFCKLTNPTSAEQCQHCGQFLK